MGKEGSPLYKCSTFEPFKDQNRRNERRNERRKVRFSRGRREEKVSVRNDTRDCLVAGERLIRWIRVLEEEIISPRGNG